MALFSPAKLLVVLVVALIVLGPDKLPKVTRQIGALVRDVRTLRDKLESEVRGTFPDLPSAGTITEAMRSPLRFIDQLTAEEPPGASSRAEAPGGSGSDPVEPAVRHAEEPPVAPARHDRTDRLTDHLDSDPTVVIHELGPDRLGSGQAGMN